MLKNFSPNFGETQKYIKCFDNYKEQEQNKKEVL